MDWDTLLSRIRSLRDEAKEEDAVMAVDSGFVDPSGATVSNSRRRVSSEQIRDDDEAVEYAPANIARTKRQKMMDSK